MPPEPRDWVLVGFGERLDEWIEREDPGVDLRFLVTARVLARLEDPYTGVRRAEGFPNLWFGTAPRSWHSGSVVTCSYWIDESTGRIRCDSVATLFHPV